MVRATKRREEIEKWFAVREREGLSLRELSERSGIPVGTLGWWNHELKKRPGRRRARRKGFVELVVGGDQVERKEGREGIRISLRSGRVVEFPADYDPDSLTRLVQLLEGC